MEREEEKQGVEELGPCTCKRSITGMAWLKKEQL